MSRPELRIVLGVLGLIGSAGCHGMPFGKTSHPAPFAAHRAVPSPQLTTPQYPLVQESTPFPDVPSLAEVVRANGSTAVKETNSVASAAASGLAASPAALGWRKTESTVIQQMSAAVADVGSGASRTVTPGRLDIPAELPGASAPALVVPMFDRDVPIENRRSAIEKLYKALPVLALDSSPMPEGSEGGLALAQLEQMAVENSPVLRQAEAEVEASRGQCLQAGLYPNPTIGYQADTVGTAASRGYQGAFVSQEFVTGGKLTLGQQRAVAEINKAEAELRRARIEVVSKVRRSYYQVLLAQQKVRLSRALSQLSVDLYRAQIDLVAGGESAPYEPVQLRVLALQSRNEVLRAQNDYLGAWRGLAASLGMPDMQPQGLSGAVDRVAPSLNYDAARQWLETTHSDLAVAQAEMSGASSHLDLQRVMPYPNLTVAGVMQRDYTASQLDTVTYNLQVGFPLPVFDRNQGNIQSAEAKYMKSQQAWNNSRNRLLSELSESFQAYATAQQLAEVYRTDLLPSQVQAYRGVYSHFRSGNGEIDFAQVVVSQQTLAQVVNEYLRILNDQWQASVSLAETLQFDDLNQMEAQIGIAPVPVSAPAPQLPVPQP